MRTISRCKVITVNYSCLTEDGERFTRMHIRSTWPRQKRRVCCWRLQSCPQTLTYSPHALPTPLHQSHAYNRCTLIFHGRDIRTPRPTMHTLIGGSGRWKNSSLVGGRALTRTKRPTGKMSSPRARAISSCLPLVERSWTDFGTTASGNHSDSPPPSSVPRFFPSLVFF